MSEVIALTVAEPVKVKRPDLLFRFDFEFCFESEGSNLVIGFKIYLRFRVDRPNAVTYSELLLAAELSEYRVVGADDIRPVPFPLKFHSHHPNRAQKHSRFRIGRDKRSFPFAKMMPGANQGCLVLTLPKDRVCHLLNYLRRQKLFALTDGYLEEFETKIWKRRQKLDRRTVRKYAMGVARARLEPEYAAYEALLKRSIETENQMKALIVDAHRAGQVTMVSEMQGELKMLLDRRAGLREPCCHPAKGGGAKFKGEGFKV